MLWTAPGLFVMKAGNLFTSLGQSLQILNYPFTVNQGKS